MPDSPKLIYQLTYRRFARNLIHEITFQVNVEKKKCSFEHTDSPTDCPIGRDGQNLCHWLMSGWPEPEQGGQATKMSETIIFKRVFMDNLFLCPDCGQFYQIRESSAWPDFKEIETDWNSFLNKIESRINVKEFCIQRCEDKKTCAYMKESSLKKFKALSK